MRILVTGGAGFIGVHVVERLLQEGHVVSIIDSLVTGRLSNLATAVELGLDRSLVFTIDIRDPAMAEAFRVARPETVIHLAAQSQVAVSMREPLLDLDVNVLGSARMLANARDHGVRRTIFASSGGTIYGSGGSPDSRTAEHARHRPVSFYGLSKRTADELGRLYVESFGGEHVSLAIGNVYGPRRDPSGESGVLAIFARQLRAGRECTILGDGSAVRDYIHVRDVVAAFLATLDRGSGLFNIGTGVGTSVRVAYEMLAARANVARSPVYVAPRTGEVPHIVLDPSRAERDLGWRSSIPLAMGIDDLLREPGGERSL